MATERLIVELDAKNKKLNAKLDQSDKKLNKLEGSTKKAEMSLASMAKVGVAGLTAIAAATSLAIVSSASYAKELEIAASRGNINVEMMQSLAFATNTVNISTEKLGDIYKDTNEKIGQFLTMGGGGFEDFVDVLRLTNDEAEKSAEAFSRMSSPEILQEMVNQMEAAGVSGQKMSFALEGMASDTTDLIPLLRNGGEELNKLRTEFDELDITLSTLDIKKIREVGIEFEKAGKEFSVEGKRLVAEYSDELINAIAATVLFGTKSAQAFDLLATGLGTPLALAQAFVNDLVNGLDTFDTVLAEREAKGAKVLAALLGVTPEDLGFNAGKAIAEGLGNGVDEGINVVIKSGKQLTDWEKLNSKQRIDISKQHLQSAKIINQELLDDNKAINAGLIIADTAAGIMRAYKESNFWVATGQAVLIAATGLAQLSNLNSASKGGGTISGGGSGGGPSQAAIPQQQDFQQDTVTQEFSVNTIGEGTSVGDITFNAEGGSDSDEFMAMSFNDALRNGRITTGRGA